LFRQKAPFLSGSGAFFFQPGLFQNFSFERVTAEKCIFRGRDDAEGGVSAGNCKNPGKAPGFARDPVSAR
jgi:hypothetical protein